VALGVILTQVLDHGTDHRSQVSTILTSIGVAPPRLDRLGLRAGPRSGRFEASPFGSPLLTFSI
jgi:uncharacterized damage-inducible protein DinB